MFHGILPALKNTGRFEGRASRSEYWCTAFVMNLLFAFLVSYIAANPYYFVVPSELINTGFSSERAQLAWLVWGGLLFILEVMFAVSARRLHDIGESGFGAVIIIIPFVNFLFLISAVRKGTVGDNEYGPDPQPYPDVCDNWVV